MTSDAVDPTPTLTHDAPAFFATGETVVTFTATDDAGNVARCAGLVQVNDTKPPQLGAFALSPSTLKPRNHKLRTITVPTLVATDVCDPNPGIRCAVASNEPPNGKRDGNTPIDIVFDGVSIATQESGERPISTHAGAGTFTLQLRAERVSGGKGRVYTASCVAVDASGNRGGVRTATVSVPR